MNLNDEYRERVDRIDKDTMFDSFFSRMVAHPDFLELVKLGDEIIPFILEDMENGEPSWVHINLIFEVASHDIDFKVYKSGKFDNQILYWVKWGKTWKIEQRENKLKRILKDT